jgi:hypothetical protein
MSQFFTYPASSNVSNASVAPTYGPVPTSATLVAGKSPTNTLVPMNVDSSGNIIVSPLTTSSTVTVVQPTGTNLHTVVDSGSISVNNFPTIQPVSGTVTVVQPTGTNLHTVVDSSALPSGASTSALQSAANSSLSTLVTNTSGVIVTQGSTTSGQSGQLIQGAVTNTSPNYTTGQTSPLSLTLTGALRIDGSQSTSPLPTGAATSALQTAGNTYLASIDTKNPALGQALAASSVPVVLTSAQLSTLTPLTSVTVTQTVGTNLHAVIDSGSIAVSNFPTTQPVSGTVTVANPSTNYALESGGNLATIATNSATQATSVNQTASNGFLSTIATNTPTVGQKASAGSSPVVIANDQSAIPVKSSVGRVFANTPTVTTYATPVTSTTFVTIVASTTLATNLVELFDSSGVAIYFAVGAVASEVIQFVIYPGGNGQVPLSIPAGSRISYKAVSASATGASAYNVLNLYT